MACHVEKGSCCANPHTQKKKKKSDPANYRPISLLSAVGKIFERIVVEAITSHLQELSLLSDQQYGFRSSRCTTGLNLYGTLIRKFFRRMFVKQSITVY